MKWNCNSRLVCPFHGKVCCFSCPSKTNCHEPCELLTNVNDAFPKYCKHAEEVEE